MSARADLRIELPLLALLALLWGSSYLFIKVALTGIPPVTLIALRVLGAALFLCLVLWFRGERLPRDGCSWRMLGVQATFNSIGAWTVLAWGQQFVDSGLASVLNSTSPIFVFLFTAMLTRHEALGGHRLLGACLGMFGVVMVLGTETLSGLGAELAGQMACLAGAALYACAAIYAKRFEHITATAAAAGTMIWATAVLLPAAMFLDHPWTLSPGFHAMGAALVLSIACTGLALMIYFRLVRSLGSLGVASQSYLRAGVGVALGIVLLGESLRPAVAAGLALAVLGVVLINWPLRSRSRP